MIKSLLLLHVYWICIFFYENQITLIYKYTINVFFHYEEPCCNTLSLIYQAIYLFLKLTFYYMCCLLSILNYGNMWILSIDLPLIWGMIMAISANIDSPLLMVAYLNLILQLVSFHVAWLQPYGDFLTIELHVKGYCKQHHSISREVRMDLKEQFT